MPLKVMDLVEQRLAVLQDSVVGTVGGRGVRRHGISRETFYDWQRRYDADGLAGLIPRSRRPQRAAQLTADLEDTIVRLRKQHGWGPEKIRDALRREGLTAPAASTVQQVLARRGRPGRRDAQPAARPGGAAVRTRRQQRSVADRRRHTAWPTRPHPVLVGRGRGRPLPLLPGHRGRARPDRIPGLDRDPRRGRRARPARLAAVRQRALLHRPPRRPDRHLRTPHPRGRDRLHPLPPYHPKPAGRSNAYTHRTRMAHPPPHRPPSPPRPSCWRASAATTTTTAPTKPSTAPHPSTATNPAHPSTYPPSTSKPPTTTRRARCGVDQPERPVRLRRTPLRPRRALRPHHHRRGA